MSIAIYFGTEKYTHLIAVEKEDDIEAAVYADLKSVGLDKESFSIVDEVYVVTTDNPLETDYRLGEIVEDIINKFKGENESA